MATKPKASATPNFTDILDAPSNEIARPTPVPPGQYVGMVKGMYQEIKSAQKQTRGHEYTIQLIEPLSDKNGENVDVDPTALQEALTMPNGDVKPLAEKSLAYRQWITENSLWRYKDFLTDLGIPEEDDDGNVLSTRQRAELTPGRSCIVTVTHTPSTDGTAVFANITDTAVLPE